jgi:DNA-binding NarL/FixJ family response regulator
LLGYVLIKIIVADDHILIREGLKKLCESEVDLQIVAETDNPGKIIDLVETYSFDVLVLDIMFPNKSGLDLLKDIKHIKPEVKVLVLSMHPEDRYAMRALRAGAAGYISKDENPEELIEAIRVVHSGKKYISEELAQQLAFNLDPSNEKPPHEMLSDREYQVMVLIAEGKSQTQIAEILNLGISTVNTYRSRILDKLEFNSNAEIIHYAIQQKLIES